MIRYYFLITICLIVLTGLRAQDYERYKALLDTTFSSQYLGFEKEVSVTVPVEWQEGMDYSFPLIVIFDRQNRRSHDYIINTIDYLTSNEQIPSAVILSVKSEEEYRYPETLHRESKDQGLARKNEKFIFDELIHFAESELMANGFRLLIGHSRYGFYTSWLFASRIDDLNAVISLSPFFSQINVELADSISNLRGQSLDVMKYWRFGIGNDFPDDFHQMDSVVQTLEHDFIDADGVLFPEAGHYVTPGLTIARALYDIFEYWAAQQEEFIADDVKDIEWAVALERRVQKHYGNDLRFSLGTLNGKGWQFFNRKEYQNAIEAWQLMMTSYPNFSEGILYQAYAKKELEQDLTTTIEEFKTSLEESEIYSVEEKKELLSELKDLNP